jgi:hypothetical protein
MLPGMLSMRQLAGFAAVVFAAITTLKLCNAETCVLRAGVPNWGISVPRGPAPASGQIAHARCLA